MVTTAFSMGNIVPCSKDSSNVGYVGGGKQESMYSLGLTLLIIVVVLIPVYLFVVPCCFRNPDAAYNLDQIFEENDEERGSRD